MTNSIMQGFMALDLTDDKGFLCGNILADLGVDVIKIEEPGGDRSRNIPPFYHDEHDPEKSLYWFAYNANKRGVTLNLETEAGRNLFKKMVEKADFVIESFPPGYMAGLGLDYADLSKINPRVIMTSITPFGRSGPDSALPADSDIVLQALGTMLRRTGDPDRAPVQITSVPQSYMHAGADAAEGTMMAHYYRSLTGEGQHVDVSIMESILGDTAAIGDFDATGQEVKRTGSLFTSAGLTTPTIWECKDGYVSFMLRGGIVGRRTNKALTEWMDSEQMAPDFMKKMDWEAWDWFQTNQAELDALAEAIGRFFKTHTKDELNAGAVRQNASMGEVYDEQGIKGSLLIGKICNSADLMTDEQLNARDFWVDVEHDELGQNITYPGAFANFSLTPMKEFRRAPRVGEHNNEFYSEVLNVSPGELEKLKADGVI
jgi:crotonobetainyl-CoA:carnitine CoA-transferase CaiB-like acyl-CoA transferase